MQQFIILILFILTALVTASVTLDSHEIRYYRAQLESPKTLILGDSRAMALHIEDGKTIAIPGEPLAIRKYYISRALKDIGLKPNAILLNLTPGDLHYARSDKRLYMNQDNWFNSHKTRIAKVTGIREVLTSKFSFLQKLDLLLCNISLFHYYQLQLSGTGGRYYANSKFDSPEFDPVKSLENVEFGSELSKNTLIDLEEIYDLCAQHEVNLVLFQTPYTHHFWEIIPPRIILEHDSILRTYNMRPNSSIIVNLVNKKDFQLNDFYDCTHLNESGGRAFSQLLHQELARLDSACLPANALLPEANALQQP